MGRVGDGVVQEYYEPHMRLSGRNRQSTNNSTNRLALIERMHRRTLTEMCVNRFKWVGLPSNVDIRFLELTLFRYGLSIFHQADTTLYGKESFMALQGGPSGMVDSQDRPIAYTVYGNTYQTRQLRADECVPIWSNYLHMPDLDIVEIYATKLADLDRTIEINSHNARRPKVLAINETQRLSIQNMIRQIDEGNPVVEVNGQPGGYDATMVQGFDLGVDPDTIEKLHILRTRLMGECMTALGIDNANQDKKERMVASEVDANNGQVMSMRAVNLNARQTACDKINEMFDLKVSVDYHVDSDVPTFTSGAS